MINNSFVYAWGDQKISYHNKNRGGSYFFISSDDKVYFSGEKPETESIFFLLHGVILILTWLIFNFFGIYVARNLKHLSYWVWLHRLFNGSAALATIILGSIAISRSSLPLK